ncbi:MAG: hypothetical protein L3J58_11780 [Emcibacter sp.]|nr:hypothetical protein [Emcibacter sp.]
MNDHKIERPDRAERPERPNHPVGKDARLLPLRSMTEAAAVYSVYMMAVESIDPELFAGLEDALKFLSENRNLYVNFDGVLTDKGK